MNGIRVVLILFKFKKYLGYHDGEDEDGLAIAESLVFQDLGLLLLLPLPWEPSAGPPSAPPTTTSHPSPPSHHLQNIHTTSIILEERLLSDLWWMFWLGVS